MKYVVPEIDCQNIARSSKLEWLLTNGRGGYAMGTVAGLNSRRYHGHLIAAVQPPTDRVLVLGGIEAEIKVGIHTEQISSNQYSGTIHPSGYKHLVQFEADESARWTFSALGATIQKELVLVQGEETAWVRYRNLSTVSFDLILKPLVAWRDHHGNFNSTSAFPKDVEFSAGRTTIAAERPVFLVHEAATCTPVQGWYYRFEHTIEAERGLDPRDDLYCPCELRYRLAPGEEALLACSLSENPTPPTWPQDHPAVTTELSPALKSAAQKFLVDTGRRKTILAGYPWFTDWGRDTMISLPGICLLTGRHDWAQSILHSYADLLKNGLIPNRVVKEGETPDYNTVDATLWFANAIYKTLAAKWDQQFAEAMLPKLHQIFWHHQKGTEFGICVDPEDGLLSQGEEGANLTWMDAKIGDWVVTPRYGKPIEVNALWINLLRVTEWIAGRVDEVDALPYRAAAEKAEASFEAKFWHEGRGHYLDTADPNDASLRPNQVIAMAMPFTPCDTVHAARALAVVQRELLTPIGLRTLGRNEPGYRPRFEGDMGSRDSAYHQGTVWPWLLGSFATALVRHGADVREARKSLRSAISMLWEYGLGGVAEVYDGDPPHRPGGCPWQAWSVAEILRAWEEDCGGD